MNLDDLEFIGEHDPHGMLAEIDALPAQLQTAWEMGKGLSLGELKPKGFSRILIAGMGGSAIGADLVSAFVAPTCPIPVVVHRDYGLPAWANGSETLVIASSHSGNTEETLDAFESALARGCQAAVVCTGGTLARRAEKEGVPVWSFKHPGQPRAAVGYSFGLMLGIFTRLGLLPDPEQELVEAVSAMRKCQEKLVSKIPVPGNPAKRLAGQLVGRWVNVYGAGILAPVARRWKGQINELAKAGAGFEFIPEADHNALAGANFPEEALSRTFNLFLHAPLDHPRNRRRLELTRKALMVAGMNTDFYEAGGGSRLSHMWTALHFGDYTAFYLAMAYAIDPWDTSMLEQFKAAMGSV